MNVKLLIVLTVSLALCVGDIATASEKTTGNQRIPLFSELDRNGDGYISRVEASILPCLGERFDRIDRLDTHDRVRPDRTGGLSRREFQQAIAIYCQ